MIQTLLKILIGSLFLGLTYSILYSLRALPPDVVNGIAYLVQAARGLDRILPVHEALAVLLFELTISLTLLPLWIFLKLWKRFATTN